MLFQLEQLKQDFEDMRKQYNISPTASSIKDQHQLQSVSKH